jgi:ATP-dependent RNA helicase SUPV3L1/SUV3
MFNPSDSRVVAVLGPTNTGKTYLAIERMLAHHSGMIGFPLRLLARENYDRVVKIKGASRVALVTGEEKIVPPGAVYFFCTVESMPIDRSVDFLAVDEIQLCADAERGHIFTDRLLHARGRNETMFLGSETIRPLLKKLVPHAEFEQRPRFSKLSYSGEKKITRLPPRSAVVAFSATEVYAIAELMRRQRGGTAVVLGALSPRTRNAQVAMFEAGEVDYLVATDAIGMGLNLNLDHVAFAKLRKFDGRNPRRLTAAEIGQIAGRAGRHMNDGTFGTTAEAGPLPAEMVEIVENHSFETLRHVFWRSRDLDMSSPLALQKSLQQRPPLPEMLRVRDAEDFAALASLSHDEDVLRLADNPASMRLLWDVCQVPDFRKILSDHHCRLLNRIFRYLASGTEFLPEDWVSRKISRIDRVDGDIDTLVSRIAEIRTWTYISHRGDWLQNAAGWQQKARAIEDRLSDALHERLTQRFVDKKAMVLARRNEGEKPLAAIMASGEVLAEGEVLGRLRGFRFDLDEAVEPDHARASLAAARTVLTTEIPQRILRFEQDNDGSFLLDRQGVLTWRGAAVGRIVRGDTVLTPAVEVLASDYVDGPGRERLRQRLAAWLNRHLRAQLKPLFGLSDAELSGSARGIAYQMIEALGLVPRHAVARQITDLSKVDRKGLSDLGIRIGRESIFMPALLNPRTAWLRAVLWATFADVPMTKLSVSVPAEEKGAADVKEAVETPDLSIEAGDPDIKEGCVPEPSLTKAVPGASITAQQIKETGFGLPDDGLLDRSDRRSGRFFQAIGFRRFADRSGTAVLVRADALERVSNEAHRLVKAGPFAISDALTSRAGCSEPAMEVLLPAIRFQRSRNEDGATVFVRRPRKSETSEGSRRDGKAREKTARPGSKPGSKGEAVKHAEDKEKAENSPSNAPPQSGPSLNADARAALKPQTKAKPRPKAKGSNPNAKPKWRGDPDSPFAVLRGLSFGK